MTAAGSGDPRVTTLPRLDPMPPGRPQRPGVLDSQQRAAGLARDPASWTADAARAVIADYETLATAWDFERGAYRPAPLRDALARGGPWPAGTCVEVAAGTGLLTPLLRERWAAVLSVDLSAAMLHRSTAPYCAIADAARLPVPSASVAVVALADAPLFATEVVRVLRSDGIVLWSNALGDAAPQHVPTTVLLDALDRAGGSWRATQSEAEWGCWCVLRRRREAEQRAMRT